MVCLNLERIHRVGIAVRTGDLFSIPLDATSMGLGVVAGKWNAELYLVLFKERFNDLTLASKAQLEELTPVFASSSLDAKLWHSHWIIVRRDVDVSMIKQPIYKVEESGEVIAESFDRKFREIIGVDAAKNLNYRTTVAPIGIEKALMAYHGLESWNPMYDKFNYENVLKSIEPA